MFQYSRFSKSGMSLFSSTTVRNLLKKVEDTRGNTPDEEVLKELRFIIFVYKFKYNAGSISEIIRDIHSQIDAREKETRYWQVLDSVSYDVRYHTNSEKHFTELFESDYIPYNHLCKNMLLYKWEQWSTLIDEGLVI